MPNLVESIYEQLGGAGGPYNGLSYGLSEGNQVVEFLPTPELWGHNPAVNDYEPTATNLRTALQSLASRVEHTLDISTLKPLPDGLFLDALRDGIASAAKTKQFVVRVMVGVYYPLTPFVDPTPDIFRFIEGLQAPQHIPVYIGAMQSGWTSWNHSKLVMRDGSEAISGGHNQWSDTYCQFAPVHDCSIRLSGPAVAVAQSFLNLQWQMLSRYSRTAQSTKWYWSRLKVAGRYYDNALPRIQISAAPASGTTQVLALGRLGAKLVPSGNAPNASRNARVAAMRLAQHDIKLSQQMLGSTGSGGVDDEFFEALCARIAAGVTATIIISDDGASNASGVGYSGYGVAQTSALIAKAVGRISGKTGADLAQWLQQHVHVGPVRMWDKQPSDPQGQMWKWRNDSKAIEPANHAKVYIVDDSAYYVGSDNAYPILNNPDGLQEFGFLVHGATETAAFLDSYWNPFWRYSSQFQFTDWSTVAA
jgi:hypothetical protein